MPLIFSRNGGLWDRHASAGARAAGLVNKLEVIDFQGVAEWVWARFSGGDEGVTIFQRGEGGRRRRRGEARGVGTVHGEGVNKWEGRGGFAGAKGRGGCI